MACLYIQHVALERENVISSFTVQGVKSTGEKIQFCEENCRQESVNQSHLQVQEAQRGQCIQ